MEVVGREGSRPSFVPLKESRLAGSVEGPLGNLFLSQRYSFTRQQSVEPLEVLYRFPLPGDAAVKGATVRFGDVEIKTSLKERDEAKAEYDAAKSEGRQAALVSRESQDSFTLSITGIEPDVEVEVLVEFVAVARPVGLGWELRFPLTLAPRYVRQDEAGTTQADSNPLALAVDPGHRFSMKLDFTDARDIVSSTHEISIETTDGVSTAALARDAVIPDRDLLLSWRPDVGDNPLGGRMYVEKGSTDADAYFLLLAASGQGNDAPKMLKREVTLLIDHSGSMEGTKWQAADRAAKKFLSGLGEEEHFNVAFFHNEVFPFSNKILRASSKNIDKAIEFVTKNDSSGGTELGVALERMLMLPKVSPKPGEKIARQLLVITDAEVTDEGRVLELARRESENGARRRISVLCIDSSPNSTLTNHLAELGGGTAAYLTSAPGEDEVTAAVDEILYRWSRPVAESVTLEIAADELRIAGKKTTETESGSLMAELGSLMGEIPLWIVGKISGFGAESHVKACFDEFTVDVPVRRIEGGAVRSIYGARKIQELEYLKPLGLESGELSGALSTLGYETQAAGSKVYKESEKAAAEDMIDALLLKESLRYGVVSSRTALVASRKEKGKLVEGTALTPNALPHGWVECFAYSEPVCACAFLPMMMRDPDLTLIRDLDMPIRSENVFLRSRVHFLSTMKINWRDVFQKIGNLRFGKARSGSNGEIAIYDAQITLSAAEASVKEFVLGEIFGSRRLIGLAFSDESLALLAGEKKKKLDGLTLHVYVDGGARPSVSATLADLMKLGHPLDVSYDLMKPGSKRPRKVSYTQSVRFTLTNEGRREVTLKKLSLFAFVL
jgi:Ca-activated chloride channel family protein